MSEIEIVWRDPPPKVSRSLWANRLAPLRERPGQTGHAGNYIELHPLISLKRL